jgi:hypothetical protein
VIEDTVADHTAGEFADASFYALAGLTVRGEVDASLAPACSPG